MKKIFFFFLLLPFFSLGQNWKDVGGGMTGTQPFFDQIYCLYVDTATNLLYAGGHFHSAGSVPANYIAKWDGVSWSVVGSNNTPNAISSIAIDSNTIYACGEYPSVWKNSGGSWFTMSPFNDNVRVVAMVNGELYAGGDFTSFGATQVNHIAKRNGIT